MISHCVRCSPLSHRRHLNRDRARRNWIRFAGLTGRVIQLDHLRESLNSRIGGIAGSRTVEIGVQTEIETSEVETQTEENPSIVVSILRAIPQLRTAFPHVPWLAVIAIAVQALQVDRVAEYFF